jgi:hypothetical protein
MPYEVIPRPAHCRPALSGTSLLVVAINGGSTSEHHSRPSICLAAGMDPISEALASLFLVLIRKRMDKLSLSLC